MMRLFLWALCLWVGVGMPKVWAQGTATKAEIRGVVIDSISGKPLRQASVSLVTARDSGYVTAIITDGEGHFRLRNVANGHYRLLITFLGYRNASRLVTIGTHETGVDVGVIQMLEQSSQLQEVVVRQESAPITIRHDTIEFNAGSFKTQPNAQVEELLRKLPGMEVSRDGTIKAQGQTVNRVLVDGKPFFGGDPKVATRNLPADIIDKVQLYDQSSDQSQFSGMDDGNRERTINLTIKRDKRKGYFGQNAVGIGTAPEQGPHRYQGRLNLNRFNNGRQLSVVGQANNLNQQNFTLGDGNPTPVVVGGPGMPTTLPGANTMPANIVEVKALGTNYRDKLGKRAELSASYFLNQSITTTDQQSHRESILPGQALLTDQTSYAQDQRTTHRLNTRLDWQLDSLTSLRLTPIVSWQMSGYNSRLGSRSVVPMPANGNPTLLNTGQTSYGSSGQSLIGYNNLLLMRKFRKEGRTFSANLNTQLNRSQTTALNQSTNTFYDSLGVKLPKVILLNQQNRQVPSALQHTLTLSFTEPLSLTQKLEIQYGYATTRNRADRTVNNWDENTGQYNQLNTPLSNQFDSRFLTHRLGATLQTRRLRYTYNLGFDVQQATLQTLNRTTDTTNTRRYSTGLPNALFSYTFSRNRSLRIQYRTRLNAPSITQLQPIVDNTNPLAIRMGNPALRPEYYNTVTLNYNGAAGVGNRSLLLFGSLNQSNTRIGTATTISDAGVQTTRPVNAGGYWSANGYLSVARPLQSWPVGITLTTSAGFSRAMGFINNQANISKTISAGQGVRLQSNYNEKIEYGVSASLGYQSVTYSLLTTQNTAYWSQYATADLHWELPFRFVFTTDLTYSGTTGRAAGYNQQFVLWNMALAKQFFKGKQGEVRMQVFDLLNQNRSLVRNTTDTYVEDVQSQVLRRYLLISFVYNLRKFGV